MTNRNNNKNNNSDGTVEGIPPEQIMCTKQACAIQYCLNRHNYQEKHCKAYVDEWKKCRDTARRIAAKNSSNNNNKNK